MQLARAYVPVEEEKKKKRKKEKEKKKGGGGGGEKYVCRRQYVRWEQEQ